jgi:hypothetical protein
VCVNPRREGVNRVNRIFDRVRLAPPRAAAPRDAFGQGEDPRIRQAAAAKHHTQQRPVSKSRPSFVFTRIGTCVPILLQKSLMVPKNSDSVAVMHAIRYGGERGWGGSITTKSNCFIHFILMRQFSTIIRFARLLVAAL